MSLDPYKKKLREAGYKLTPQRLAIIEAIQSHPGTHLSTEEIYEIVRVTHSDMGLATVYRTAQLLEELGIITSLNIEDGRIRYELYTDEGQHNHHHLICTQCGSVSEFEEDLLDELEERIQSDHRFKILDHKLKFYGICSKCQDLE